MANDFYLLGNGIGGPHSTGAGKQAAYKRSITRFRDPLTPPQTKTDCIHTIEPIPGVILCDGWRTFWRFMEVEHYIIVRSPNGTELQQLVESCLREGAVAALLSGLAAAFLSGGAAIEAAKAAFIAALLDCLKRNVADVSIDLGTESHWTDWE